MLDRFFIAIHWAVFLYALILPIYTADHIFFYQEYKYYFFDVKGVFGEPFFTLLPYAVFIIVLWIIKGKLILLPWKHGR